MAEQSSLAAEPYCYLTTAGRVTGRPHEIEIWFGMKDAHARRGPASTGPLTIYLLSGGRDGSDWVKNLSKNPSVQVRIGSMRFEGTARRVAPNTAEDRDARKLLLSKYASPGDDLAAWAKNALPIAIELRISGGSA